MFVYLGEISGINFNVDPHLDIKATYHLKDIPWDEALALLLEDNELNIDSAINSMKIFRGQKYKLVFTKYTQAKIAIFLYRHIFKLIFILLLFPAVFIGFHFYRKHKKAVKYPSKELLDQAKSDEIKKRLIFLLEVEKMFRNEKLTLLTLAENLGVTPHQLSWIINDKMDQSFSALVNRYRIEDVKKKLENDMEKNTSILQMALDSGFSTKTAFNRAFKRLTGVTPSQYRKKITGKQGSFRNLL